MAQILVVDDEPGIRDFVAEALEDQGHSVKREGDALAAMQQIRQHAFDLMVTDLRMPGALNGMDLLRTARADLPEMEVIVLTAHGTVELAVEAIKLGAFDFLQKPLSGPAELRLLVSRALERRRLVAYKDATERGEALPVLTYGDPTMVPVVQAITRVSSTNATVLLLGESGTGKEVAAKTIHRNSQRGTGPFVAVNCAAISEGLMESEIFGHERGAFTGATATRRGRLELADGGTLFLDEIGELKPELQAKLLRVVQDRRFERVGGTRTIEVDVRWIAATNRDIERMVGEGSFREDLYHRISVFPVRLPPLRERRNDILPLAEALLARISGELARSALKLDARAARRVRDAYWSGNIRQLANTLERAAIMSDDDLIAADDLQIPDAPVVGGAATTMVDLEREAIRKALAEVGGNRRLAAKRLGIGVRTLYEKLKRYEEEEGR